MAELEPRRGPGFLGEAAVVKEQMLASHVLLSSLFSFQRVKQNHSLK